MFERFTRKAVDSAKDILKDESQKMVLPGSELPVIYIKEIQL